MDRSVNQELSIENEERLRKMARFLNKEISFIDGVQAGADGKENPDEKINLLTRGLSTLRSDLVSAEALLSGERVEIAAVRIGMKKRGQVTPKGARVAEDAPSGDLSVDDMGFLLFDQYAADIHLEIEGQIEDAKKAAPESLLAKVGPLELVYYYGGSGPDNTPVLTENKISFSVAAKFESQTLLFPVEMEGDLETAITLKEVEADLKITVYPPTPLEEPSETEGAEPYDAEDIAYFIVDEKAAILADRIKAADREYRVWKQIALDEEGKEVGNYLIGEKPISVDTTEGEPAFVGPQFIFYVMVDFSEYLAIYKVICTGVAPGVLPAGDIGIQVEFKEIYKWRVKRRKKIKPKEKADVGQAPAAA